MYVWFFTCTSYVTVLYCHGIGLQGNYLWNNIATYVVVIDATHNYYSVNN